MVRLYLAAGTLDQLYLRVIPIILGAGGRLLEDVGDPIPEPVKVIASPEVTHVKYRIGSRRAPSSVTSPMPAGRPQAGAARTSEPFRRQPERGQPRSPS